MKKNTMAISIIAIATSMLALPNIGHAARIFNQEAVQQGRAYNGFIVRYKPESAAGNDVALVQSAVTKAMMRLAAARVIDLSFKNNAHKPFALEHKRKLFNNAHLFKPSRKMTASEALATIKELANDPDVDYVEPNLIVQTQAVPNDPLYQQQWGYGTQGVRAAAAWDLTTGAGITVAVLDTGITSHPDLTPNVVAGYDFVRDLTNSLDGNALDGNPADPGGTDNAPAGWHGTHVAGTVVAAANNNTGVVGLAHGAKIMPVRVMGLNGGETADIADGIDWSSGGTVAGVPTLATAQAAKVINLSIGGDGDCPATMQSAIDRAMARGTTVVVAAGNSGIDARLQHPANCTGVITVAATSSDGSRAWFSNHGPRVDVAAPGVDILSTFNAGRVTEGAPTYGLLNGTSMATPHVAAVAALVQSRRLAVGLPLLSPSEVRGIIKASTRPLAGDCINLGCGTGIIDASIAAVLATIQSKPVGHQTDSSGKVRVLLLERKAPTAASQFTNFAVDVPEGFVVIGGGVRGAASPKGHLLTASYPNSSRTAWLVSTKEHLQSAPTAITAWALALKIEGMTSSDLLANMTYRMISSTFSATPSVASTVPAGYTQIGGGFQVVTTGAGNFAWASYPSTAAGGAAWISASKEHGASSAGSIRTYSIGIRTNLPVGIISASSAASGPSALSTQPAATATLDGGYALTGCGAHVNWAGSAGNLLWQMRPSLSTGGPASCDMQATEHIYGSPATINAFALGIRLN